MYKGRQHLCCICVASVFISGGNGKCSSVLHLCCICVASVLHLCCICVASVLPLCSSQGATASAEQRQVESNESRKQTELLVSKSRYSSVCVCVCVCVCVQLTRQQENGELKARRYRGSTVCVANTCTTNSTSAYAHELMLRTTTTCSTITKFTHAYTPTHNFSLRRMFTPPLSHTFEAWG